MFPLAKASTSSTLSDIAAPEAGSWLDEKVEGPALQSAAGRPKGSFET